MALGEKEGAPRNGVEPWIGHRFAFQAKQGMLRLGNLVAWLRPRSSEERGVKGGGRGGTRTRKPCGTRS